MEIKDMSEEKAKTQQSEQEVQESSESTGLSAEEKSHLDALIENKKQTQAAAEKALLKNENAELQYKNFVLQVYMKYGLGMSDTISEEGKFVKESSEQK